MMIWLDASGGAGSIGGSVGTASVNNINWNLHKGTNGDTTVFFCFVASSRLQNGNPDLKQFFNWLANHSYIDQNQYLTTIQAGVEPFSGSSKLFTSAYSVSIK
ncbi:endoglucanase-1 [Jimgerdemannia flammicorona]|uniref:Endoglucanase-1 n=1 Tax=Jimgerdemannia flammicorona TaxID=994334 RepID=A0A433QC10_9FUNG|nr:endoglucanase-1 [Jimgerdemannia flammicorona]